MLERSLFVSDGVLMHQHRPLSVGLAAIRAVYERISSESSLEINIDIKEIIPVAPDWAFSRMESKERGKSAQRQHKAEVTNQALVIFQKIKVAEQRADGEGEVWEWRLARCCSSNTTASPKLKIGAN